MDGTDPLSERITLEQLHPGSSAGPPLEWQIVGVFHDIQNGGPLGEPDHPEICVPFAQNPWPQATLAVRTAIDPERITSAITAAVHSLDPNLPLANVKTMQQIAHDRFIGDRFGIALYGSLAAIALILAAVGIYGVLAFTVAQSTSEIGLRMALGATANAVLLRVLKQGLAMAGTGLALGIVGAYFTTRAMQSTLYGIGPLDWGSIIAGAAILLLAAFLACYVPARKASAIDPMVALRQG